MRLEKLIDIESKRLLKLGLTCSGIAGRFGLSRSPVSERLKALEIGVSKGCSR
jgi:DNA-binding Lrp family transcriptional regulator